MVALPKTALIKFGSSFVTDHNRQPVQISVERIEKATRTAMGTMRKYVVADKKTWEFSWTDLPAPTAKTVDGNLGADGIDAFYTANKGAFTLTVTAVTGTTTYSVMFTDYSRTLSKRGIYDMYDLDCTVVEV